jgi:hypothetical protein
VSDPAYTSRVVKMARVANIGHLVPRHLANIGHLVPRPLANIGHLVPRPLTNIGHLVPRHLANIGHLVPRHLANVGHLGLSHLAEIGHLATMVKVWGVRRERGETLLWRPPCWWLAWQLAHALEYNTYKYIF